MDYLYTSKGNDQAFRDALRILSDQRPIRLGPNPLGLSPERMESIARWNAEHRP